MATPSYNDDTFLARWLSGELSPQEEATLRKRPEFKDYERLLGNVERMQPPAYNTEDAFAALQKARTAPDPKTRHLRPRRQKSLRLWYGAAAAIILLLSTWFLLQLNADENYRTAPGAELLAQGLSDGSEIRLNDATTFGFVSDDTTRRAKLGGEAFFKVEKSTTPFIVETELGAVTVVGTEFNIYSRGDSMSVYCTEGMVKVAFAGAAGEYTLTAGMAVGRNALGQVNTDIGTPGESLDWLDNRSVFVNRPLAEILEELERQYNVVVERPTGMDLRKKYDVEFPHDDLTQALQNTFNPVGMDFEIRNNTIIPLPRN